MNKSGKTTLEIVCMIIVALSVSITAWLVYVDTQKPLVADINCMHWKTPQSVVRDLKTIDANETTAVKPNRMTAKDANQVCSIYTTTIHNKDKDVTYNTRMTIPTALHWEVTWMNKDGLQRKVYSGNELIPLPDIQGGTDVNVITWAHCKPARPGQKDILITQNNNHPARLNVITPVRASFQRLDQLMPIGRRYSILVSIAFISIGVLIIRKKYSSRKQ